MRGESIEVSHTLTMGVNVIKEPLMPVKLERELKKTVSKKFPKNKEKQNAYVYGTLNKVKKKK